MESNLTPDAQERLFELLFERTRERLIPPRRIHMVLDGARDEAIHRLIVECPHPKECLYRGELAPDLAAAAPWLVELDPGHEWTRTIVARGWGNAWGIFVESMLPMDALRRHLRTFLKVKDEDGRMLVFRWYDPRVLRVYLPTCNGAEARTIFGVTSRWFQESEDGAALLVEEPGTERVGRTIIPLEVPRVVRSA